MEIKVGVKNINREVVVDSTDKPDQVREALTTALADDDVFVINGERGRTVYIPSSGIGYVEISEQSTRPVGFGAV